MTSPMGAEVLNVAVPLYAIHVFAIYVFVEDRASRSPVDSLSQGPPMKYKLKKSTLAGALSSTRM